MELDECIKSRRSVRAYKDEPVPREKIESILEAGVWAATGMGKQPWRFIIIEDKSIIKFVSDETKKTVIKAMPAFAKRFETEQDIICYNAPVLIFICSEVDPNFSKLYLEDCVLAAQNMFLKAHELGLGACYMGWIDVLNRINPESIKKAGVPEGYEMKVPLILGYPKSQQGLGKRSAPVILKWIK
ncbi:MAG: nitroreductase family protein [Candidatus Methanomethylicaceae archaeon]|jgi:nitroreductase